MHRQSLTVYPTSQKERSMAIGIGSLLFLLSAAALLMSDQIWIRFRLFLLIQLSVSAFTEWTTAYLLYGEFKSTRNLGILALSVTYFSCGLLTGFHLLTIPGIFVNQAIVGMGMPTASWLWTYWHVLFPIGILTYLLLGNKKISSVWTGSRLNGLILALFVGFVLAISGLTFLTIHYQHQLPTIWMKHELDSAFVRVAAYFLAIFTLSLCFWLWIRRRSTDGILLWLGIALFGGLLELVLTLFYNHSFTFGWYMARLDNLCSSIAVLCAMLFQFNRIQSIVNSTQDSFHETEKMLRDSELQYHSFFQHNLDPMFSMDSKGRITSANPAFSRVTGYSNTELLKFRLVDLVASDSKLSVQRAIQRIMDGEPQHLEASLVALDGTCIELHLTAVPIRSDEQITGVYGIGKDVTEHKRVEAALRESEAKYRFITDNMSDLIVVVESNGLIRYVSPSSLRLFGTEPQEYYGKSIYEWIEPQDHPVFEKMFEEMERTRDIGEAEIRISHRTRGTLLFECRSMPVFEENGAIMRSILVARDSTERKRTEELLIRSEKLSVIGQLAAGVAHEIRNPLTAIKGFLQLMQAGDIRKQEYFDIMSDELNRIQTIVSELLVLAKPQYMTFEPKDIHQLLVYVVTLLQSQANLKNIQIQLVAEEKLFWVKCDENQLKQVFINFLKNAIEATEAIEGSGEIRIQIERCSTDEVKVSVFDNGCGIPEDRLPRLGEPFYTTKEKGTGLGLMVSHKIVEAHGGRIEYQSEVNTGTQVTVYLPCAPDPFA